MKLMGTIVGSLIVLVVVILTPWPDFVLGVANKMLIKEASGDVVWEFLVKAFMVTVSYIVFPVTLHRRIVAFPSRQKIPPPLYPA